MRFEIEVDKKGFVKIKATNMRENAQTEINWAFTSSPSDYDAKTNTVQIPLISDADYNALKRFLGEMHDMKVNVYGEEKYNYSTGKTNKPALLDSIKPYAPVEIKSTAASSSSSKVDFNLSDIFRPRKVDIQKPRSDKDRQGFDKSQKYPGQVVKDDPTHRVGGHYRTTGGVLSYFSTGKAGSSWNPFAKKTTTQKERFVQPAPVSDYFTYYCYEIYQYCGVNTPKYRYGTNINNEFSHVSTLIPADKIPQRDVLFQGVRRPPDTPKLQLADNQYMKSLDPSSKASPSKVSGNLFGGHLVGFLLQNHDMGGLNGYFVERQKRQHYIVIDMNKVSFNEDEYYRNRRFQFNAGEGKDFDHLATQDQKLAVVSKVDQLLKGDLEKIYYSPRATKMFYELQPKIAREMLSNAAQAAYGTGIDKHLQSILDKFEKDVQMLILKAKDQNVPLLCEQIRELALKYQKEIASLPDTHIHQSINNARLEEFSLKDKAGEKKEEQYQNWQKSCDDEFAKYLRQPKFSPDMQVAEIRKDGQVLIEKYAPDPQTLRDFEARERERGQIADQVVSALKISPPDDEVVKGYIVEDLRGKYYEKYKDQELIDQLVTDFANELRRNIPKKSLSTK